VVGDGVPYDIFAMLNGVFTGITDDGQGGAGVEFSLSTRNQDEVEVFAGTASAHLEDY